MITNGLSLLHPEAPGHLRPPEIQTEEQDDRITTPWILCRDCRRAVTLMLWSVERQGSHVHTFFNPSGRMFEVICFSKAPGCIATGPQSDEFTWFNGCSWQVGVCSGCLSHLGWRFSCEASSFWALIRSRLALPG